MKKILAILLCAFCLFALAACEQPEPPKNTDWETITQPTCTTEGKKQRYVDDVLQEETIPALGHDFPTEWTVTQNETCTTDGNEQRKCTRCPQVENRAITAHHVLKDEQIYNWDEHYFECENCTEKIDLAGHHFSIDREEKYAYVIDYSSNNKVYRVNIGHVDTLTCTGCAITIKDSQVLSKYYSNNSGGYSSWAKSLYTPMEKYNILYGFTFETSADCVNFEYDANYNLLKVYYAYVPEPNLRAEYNYVYENGVLKQIEFTCPFVTVTTYLNFQYENDCMIVTCTRNNNVYRYLEYDSNGVISKEIAYSYPTVDGEKKQVKSSEIIYDAQGYMQSVTNWTYNVDGQLSNESNVQAQHTFDSLGSLMSTTLFDANYGTTLSNRCAFTYNTNNQITSCTYNESYQYNFEYDGDKLTKWTQQSTSSSTIAVEFNYQYSQGKVQAYDSSSALRLQIEYLSDYKMMN